MEKKFDLILDECIDRIILNGESVEDCVARYPEHAAELKDQLAVIDRAASAFDFAPSAEAKDLGRQKLQAEMRSLQQASATDPHPRTKRSPIFGWQHRWAIGVAAFLFVFIFGSAGTVVASRNALPGDPLYRVKLATEEVRLALEFSEKGKAELHLDYAERRAKEMSSLIKEGNISRLESTQKRLAENLNASTRITDDLEDAEEVADLNSKLSRTASQALANLQVALEEAPEASANKEVTANVFQSSNHAYSEAIERVAPRAGDRRVAAAMGTLQLRVTDPPPPNVAQVMIEVGRIEAHLAGGEEGRWITIAEEPQTFDLLRIAEVQKFLGERQIDPGLYTKVRFEIVSATVVTNEGANLPVKVPSGFLNLSRPFRVEEGKTTVVTLDFNGERSLRVTGQQEYILTPQAVVLVAEPGKQSSQPGKSKEKEDQREKDRDKDKEETRKMPESGATPTRIQLEGRIESVDSNTFTVRGKQVVIDANTVIGETAETGKKVEVDVVPQADGTLRATHVRVQKSETEEPPKHTDEKDKDKSEPTSEKRPEQAPVRLVGTIHFLSPGSWRVGDDEIVVNQDTEIEGIPAIGARAEVNGKRQPDGTILAESINIEAKAERGNDREDKRPPATPTPEDKEKTARHVEIDGVVERVGEDQWIVDGQRILLDNGTHIEGTPKTGVKVEIEGLRQEDGSVLALKISVGNAESRREPPNRQPDTREPNTPTPETPRRPESEPEREAVDLPLPVPSILPTPPLPSRLPASILP